MDAGAHEAAASPNNDRTPPTSGQAKAGNYKLGPVRVAGLDIGVENPEGSVREDKHNTPPKWRRVMKHHYGYVRGSTAFDSTAAKKQGVDVFIKPGTPEDWSGDVYVVNQTKESGAFDEHKAMIGFDSEAEARAAYQDNYEPGWNRGNDVVAMPAAEFKAWVHSEAPSQGAAKRASQMRSASRMWRNVPSIEPKNAPRFAAISWAGSFAAAA